MNKTAFFIIAAVFFASPCLMVWGIPETQLKYALEVSFLLRFLLLQGLPLGFFFCGLTIEDDLPLFIELLLFTIGLFWVFKSYPDMVSYIYVPNAVVRVPWWVAPWIIGSSLSFVGVATIMKKAVKELDLS